MLVGICIRAKDEQKIIADWAKHYLKLGFDKIVIYDNLSYPSIKETLDNKNIVSDKIELHICDKKRNNQGGCYDETLNKYKHFDWFLFCDADEFLWVKEGTIREFLSKFSDDTCSVVINWLTYGMGNQKIYDINKSVFEQFCMRENYGHYWNQFIKTFVRPKLVEAIRIHFTTNKKYKSKNVYNEILHLHEKISFNRDNKLSDNTPVVLVHYMTLDLESMLEKRKKNQEGGLFACKGVPNNKYSPEWYNTIGRFKDSVKDERMLKYV